MFLLVALLACATEEAPKPAPPAPAPVAAPPPAPALPSLHDIALTGSSHLMFSIDDSKDALALQQAACDKSAAGDAAKATACMAGVHEAAAREGIRFEQDAAGKWWYVSFGNDAAGKETVFMKGMIDVTKDEADTMVFKCTGTMEGEQVKEMSPEMLANPPEMTLHRVDATTVALDTPPPKGSLAYKRMPDVATAPMPAAATPAAMPAPGAAPAGTDPKPTAP